ncbi:DUF2516 family protein [Calidifontibacter terrae]
MLQPLWNLQTTVALLLGVVLLGGCVFAFVDSLLRRPDAYVAAGKLTKVKWAAITGVGALFALLVVQSPLGLFGILAAVSAGVYFADVRPALRAVESRRGGGRGRTNPPW